MGLFAALILVPFYGTALHIDEPSFLYYARAILEKPSRPFDAPMAGNASVPLWRINNGCPLSFELIALGLKAVGSSEWALRLFFLPLDLAAALGLYLLASRFLKRPLWPTLVTLASPAFFLNLGHLMGEKFAAAFGFMGLYALVKGVDEEKPFWFWLSALLMSATIFSKVSLGFLLPPCLAYAFARKVPAQRIAAYFAAASVLPLAYLAYYSLTYGSVLDFISRSTAQASAMASSHLTSKARAYLAFIGGTGIATAFWPFVAFRPKPRQFGILAAAVLILFSSLFDYGRVVRLEDRAVGIILAMGALWGLWTTFKHPRPERSFWISWLLGGSVIVFGLWMVSARMIAFLLPPLMIVSAETLEKRLDQKFLARFYALSLAVVLALSLPLALVDSHYANFQKQLSQEIQRDFAAPGRTLWVTGTWGLQYYMSQIGAKTIDPSGGGWRAVKAGDIAVVPWINSGMISPPRTLRARFTMLSIPEAVPLRLMGRPDAVDQAGFYSSSMGFLPWSFSRRPLDQFVVLQIK